MGGIEPKGMGKPFTRRLDGRKETKAGLLQGSGMRRIDPDRLVLSGDRCTFLIGNIQ